MVSRKRKRSEDKFRYQRRDTNTVNIVLMCLIVFLEFFLTLVGEQGIEKKQLQIFTNSFVNSEFSHSDF